MILFNENDLKVHLARLNRSEKAAFAAAVATRLLSCFERYFGCKLQGSSLRNVIVRLWACAQSGLVDESEWRSKLDEVMAMLPEEGVGHWVANALANDAVASCAFAIQCLVEDSEQAAVWAARRAYEAADQAAIQMLGIDLGLPDAERKILSHEWVQRELGRQSRDLAMVSAGSSGELATLKTLAFDEQLLSDDEAMCIGVY